MRQRTIGRLGWSISQIGYGMWGVGSWAGSEDEQSLGSLQLALDLGVEFVDTAWGYGEGRSERLLGELVRANPDRRIITATTIPPRNFRWPTQRGDLIDDAFPPSTSSSSMFGRTAGPPMLAGNAP